jgi:hypothetical protein
LINSVVEHRDLINSYLHSKVRLWIRSREKKLFASRLVTTCKCFPCKGGKQDIVCNTTYGRYAKCMNLSCCRNRIQTQVSVGHFRQSLQ